MVKFTWTMDKKGFARLKKALTVKGRVSNNVYGGFGAGRLYIDVSTMSREELMGDEDRYNENILTAYTFVAGKDAKYGAFPDNTPYDLVCNPINVGNINTSGSFEDFKSSFEAEIIRCAKEGKFCEQWNEWLTSAEYADVVQKFWYSKS